MDKKMLYRIYKKQFSDCKTLNDYNSRSKEITIIIPDDDPRIQKQGRIDTKIWKSWGDEWRMKAPVNIGFSDTVFRVKKYEDGFYIDYIEPNPDNWYSGVKYISQKKIPVMNRNEALAIVEQKWDIFKAYWESRNN